MGGPRGAGPPSIFTGKVFSIHSIKPLLAAEQQQQQRLQLPSMFDEPDSCCMTARPHTPASGVVYLPPGGADAWCDLFSLVASIM